MAVVTMAAAMACTAAVTMAAASMAAGAVITASTMAACAAMRGAQMMMERYDANKDGKLTQEEINSNREAWLKEFDANNDGKLSLDEFKQLWLKARAERIVRAFQRFDRDGDAGVTLEEYQRPLADIVERMDRNGDGP
jgi:Ca2+-binding EF-hand superfamily protein